MYILFFFEIYSQVWKNVKVYSFVYQNSIENINIIFIKAR